MRAPPAPAGARRDDPDEEARDPLLGPSATGTTRAEAALCVLVGLLGLALVWYDLAQPKGLYGVNQFDDGVNFGSAARLVSGILPYRDFTFLQPPGITVIASPIAWLTGGHTREGLALARVLTAVVTGANAFFLAWLLRHRGLVAAGVAGVALAVYPTAYFADHSLLLEPYLILGILIGTCAVFSRGALASPWRIGLGGIAFGVATSVKLWAVIPATVLAAFLLPYLRRVLIFLGGAVVGFAAVCLPFFVFAPRAFVLDVISSQLDRNATAARLAVRMWSVVGLRGLLHAMSPDRGEGQIAEGIGIVLLAIVIVGLFVPLVRGRLNRFEGYVLASGSAVVIALFVPHEFYSHYTYVTGAFIAAALGLALSRLTTPLRTAMRLRSGLDLARVAAGALLAVGIGLAAVLATGEVRFDTTALKSGSDPGAGIAAAIPAGSCVLSDAASLLIAGDRFVGPSGCPDLLDSTGSWIALDPKHPPSPADLNKPKPARLVADWRNWFVRADYVVLSKTDSFRIPWTPGLRTEFATSYVRVPAASALIYRHVRRATPAGRTG